MKDINVSELKANLSKYLRLAARGVRIVVKDRDEPIAQLGPLPVRTRTWHERLAEAGRLRPGTQQWRKLRISRSGGGVDIQTSLQAVREDPSEVQVDASAVLRLLFIEPGPAVPLSDGDRLVSSQLVEVETFRAVDRERLLGHLDDAQAATKRKELTDLLAMLDLATVDSAVIARAKNAFPINVRALDAVHVATAEILAAEIGDEVLEFWTHDDRQSSAAISRGLAVRGSASPAAPPPRAARKVHRDEPPGT